VAYLASFKKHHVDPRTLPVLNMESFNMGPLHLSEVTSAAAIVRGRVLAVEFIDLPVDPGGFPLARSRIKIEGVLRTQAGITVPPLITVLQYGGPVWTRGADLAHGTGGRLAQFDVNPVLFVGQDVVLFLEHPRTITPPWTAETWIGAVTPQLLIRNGVVAETHALFADEVLGLTVQTLTSRIRRLPQ
jgi:hypothetical protein